MRVLTMPDTWEYPWFAAWDLAFQCVTFALVDAKFAKDQLWFLPFEQFQHPSGQLPGGARLEQSDATGWMGMYCLTMMRMALDHPLFYEYFHGDNGAGIGASHQTGWTALVANLIDEWR
jgi:hypothetical protein